MKKATTKGFTLVELIITVTVLAVLTLTTVPLVQNAVRREKEQRLRDTLRQIRLAIDEFKRDTTGACQQGQLVNGNPIDGSRNGGIGNVPADPRSRVIISDCKIFEAENLDRFPPSLQILVDGVSVKPRGVPSTGGRGLGDSKENASDTSETKDQTKHYLREIPVDPISGKSDEWILRSSYQEKNSKEWDEINVFDVRSGAEGEALNGEKYSDW